MHAISNPYAPEYVAHQCTKYPTIPNMAACPIIEPFAHRTVIEPLFDKGHAGGGGKRRLLFRTVSLFPLPRSHSEVSLDTLHCWSILCTWNFL